LGGPAVGDCAQAERKPEGKLLKGMRDLDVSSDKKPEHIVKKNENALLKVRAPPTRGRGCPPGGPKNREGEITSKILHKLFPRNLLPR